MKWVYLAAAALLFAVGCDESVSARSDGAVTDAAEDAISAGDTTVPNRDALPNQDADPQADSSPIDAPTS
jgi:hypothetical protein